jgi:uncharacterized protein (UPF0371 family)
VVQRLQQQAVMRQQLKVVQQLQQRVAGLTQAADQYQLLQQQVVHNQVQQMLMYLAEMLKVVQRLQQQAQLQRQVQLLQMVQLEHLQQIQQLKKQDKHYMLKLNHKLVNLTRKVSKEF